MSVAVIKMTVCIVNLLGMGRIKTMPILAGIRQIPELLREIVRPIGVRGNEIRSHLTVPEVKSPDRPPRRAGTHRLAFIRAHLCLCHLPPFLRLLLHAGAGGARSRAISDRISANICRGTATSAIWKVT